MSDQAPEAGTPEPADPQPAAPGTTTEPAAPAVDYEQRYNDLRPQYDRTNTELQQYRQVIEGLGSEDPAVREWAAAQLGLELQQEQQEEQDQFTALAAQVAQLQEQLQQSQQQSQQDAVTAYVEQYTQVALDALDGLDDAEKAWVLRAAVALPPVESPEGVPVPDVASAMREFEEFIGAQKQSWAQTKRAPRPPASGSSATEAPNLDEMSRQDRWDHMAQRLMDAE